MNVGIYVLLKRELVLKGIYDLTFEKDFDTISIKEITEFAQIGRKHFIYIILINMIYWIK